MSKALESVVYHGGLQGRQLCLASPRRRVFSISLSQIEGLVMPRVWSCDVLGAIAKWHGVDLTNR
jgi:hypothetical protein